MYLNLIFGAKSSRFQLQKLKKKKKRIAEENLKR